MGMLLGARKGDQLRPRSYSTMETAKIENTELAEAQRCMGEFRRLAEIQRQLIEESNQRGYDVTSANIVFESLLISLSLYNRVLKHSPL